MDSVNSALQKTINIYVRNNKNELIALTRAWSDEVFTTYIADMVVIPGFQNMGVGSKMLNFIKKRYKGTGIFCDAYNENSGFLEKNGFIKRDNLTVFSKRFI